MAQTMEDLPRWARAVIEFQEWLLADPSDERPKDGVQGGRKHREETPLNRQRVTEEG